MNFKSSLLFDTHYREVDKGKILNIDIWKVVPEVAYCCNYKLFNEWFNNKFCKYTQILDISDFKFLCDEVEKFHKVVILG